MSTRPVVVVVSGLPATGKTRLARSLAAALSFPLVSKDDYKEILFDYLGYQDAERRRALGPTSFALLWHTLEQLLAAGVSSVIEIHFYHEHSTPQLRQLCARYQAQPIQLHLQAAPEVLSARAQERYASGERHPGHGVGKPATPLLPQCPLALEGPCLTVDTTDFATLELPALLDFVRTQGRL